MPAYTQITLKTLLTNWAKYGDAAPDATAKEMIDLGIITGVAASDVDAVYLGPGTNTATQVSGKGQPIGD